VKVVRYDAERHELLVDVEISSESGMEAMSSDEWLGTTVVEMPFEVTPR
jgi:hypothetical protein